MNGGFRVGDRIQDGDSRGTVRVPQKGDHPTWVRVCWDEDPSDCVVAVPAAHIELVRDTHGGTPQ